VAPFGFNPRLARLRSKGSTKWACASHRAGLPEAEKRGIKMDALQAFEVDEADDLAAAADAMARFWKAQGLGEHVAAIGREQGFEGARVLLGTYFELRGQRLDAEHEKAKRDVPFL
jgi:hypothetical protein